VQRGLLRGIAVFRWGAWAWTAVVLLLQRDEYERPAVAIAVVALTLAWTIIATVLVERAPQALEHPAAILTELAIGALLGISGALAYPQATSAGQAFSSVRTVGFAWPLAGVLTAGVAYGALAGLLAGVAVAAPRWFAPVVAGVDFDEFESGHWFSLVSTTLLYALVGAVEGYIATLLRRAESEVATARAREAVARTLHDGVLQTLAVIERRADDPDLARLAREQERELREFLYGTVDAVGGANGRGSTDVGRRLRRAAARFEDNYGGRVDVVLAPDLPTLDAASIDALAGAVGEALANAGKHGGSSRVTVYAEPGDNGGVACSVRDDGRGFDPSVTREGVGLQQSIRARMEEVGGTVDIESRPGGGTEVRLWLP
jgi:signal transduction histidine kinase